MSQLADQSAVSHHPVTTVPQTVSLTAAPGETVKFEVEFVNQSATPQKLACRGKLTLREPGLLGKEVRKHLKAKRGDLIEKLAKLGSALSEHEPLVVGYSIVPATTTLAVEYRGNRTVKLKVPENAPTRTWVGRLPVPGRDLAITVRVRTSKNRKTKSA